MSRHREPGGTVSRRRSWSILLTWGAAIALLTLLGGGLAARLAPMSLDVPGTPSSRAEAMLTARFGNTIPIAILLRGPPAEVDRQGPRVVAALREIPQVQVLSPWDRSVTMHSLRPEPGAAFVLVELRPAREPRDGGRGQDRSRDGPHRAAARPQLPDRRGGDRTGASGVDARRYRAGRADRAAGADPRAAARVPLARGRRRAAGDGRLRP